MWYADGDKIVRNEYNPATAYAFDRVFGPHTNSDEVYEVAAKPVGDQYSPGIIPLAIKDVFSIIQDVSFPANLTNVVEVAALKEDGCPKVWVVTSDQCHQQAAHGVSIPLFGKVLLALLVIKRIQGLQSLNPNFTEFMKINK
ncbi:hypothetical protein JHK82_055546 [Glycine max]|nr:hypothetical protein JHK82_055546 [Glycine max]